jgi:hypothetical protein
MSDLLEVTVDGKSYSSGDSVLYKGMMISNIPNLAFTLGYTNASWTLKADLTAGFVCKLINHMDAKGYSQCCARPSNDPTMKPKDGGAMNLNSGYVQRAAESMPKQGKKYPWKVYMNYLIDRLDIGFSGLEDGIMEFSKPRGSQQLTAASAAAALPRARL